MRVYSFVRRGIDLEVIEIELSLVPGLPTFHLIGLPDTAIKESVLRIKSALRHQGFHLPKSEQVLVHLKPSHEKKTSQGLDLAIAAAYLMKTEQVPRVQYHDEERVFFYGELSLEGNVTVPPDLDLLEGLPDKGVLVTGVGASVNHVHGFIQELKDLRSITWCESEFDSDSDPDVSPISEESPFENFSFNKSAAHLLAVAAAGEHNVFVAGPAGTGKTTFSSVLHSLLRPGTLEEKRKIKKIAKLTGSESFGRPYISPHHSTTDIALLGGGVPPKPGEITRAQHGVLVLDEFLEFQHHVKESLREPIEKHEITVSRVGAKVTFPADFLLVGMTNLCPCGEYVPTLPAPCDRSATYCKSYYQRLSGPLLDRFEIVAFSHKWSGNKTQTFNDIRSRVLSAQNFAVQSRGQTKMNSRLNFQECEALIASFVRKNLLPELPGSHRRLLALFRVARTLADLEGVETVVGRHIEGAKDLTIQPFKDIRAAWR